ncbi:MAG: response regulator [Magnetospirillum sp.]|nr:response regulator [Magnetospirillum sp.]
MAGPAIRVLLIEDEPAHARLVALQLRSVGSPPFVVAAVERLSEARRRLAEQDFDIILADLSLPDSTGLATLRALIEAAPDRPVVALTGNDDDAVALEAVKHGAQDYIVKGHGDPAMLSRILRYAIERKATERALTEARDRAQAAVRAKSLFLATVGHEIRTPLNGILGGARLLAETSADAQAQTLAATIATSGEILLRLVNDILDFSRLEAAKMPIDEVPFDVRDTVAELVATLAPRAADKGLVLSSTCSADIAPMVIGDPMRLRQILLNLIGNAIKFTDDGSVAVTVEAIGDDGRHLRFSVADTGIGVAESAHAELFEEFTQVDASGSRRYGGAGLGLAICQGLVRLMKGEIRLDSQLGQGTTVTVALPFASAEGWQPVPSTAPMPPCRVLLVDDNAINRTIATGLLDGHGHHVTAADSGEAALECARDDTDLVLLDRHMPGLDGIETARRLRARGGVWTSMPIYLLTADNSDIDGPGCHDAALDGVVLKPFRVEDVAALLGRRRRERPPPQALIDRGGLAGDSAILGRERMRSLAATFRISGAADLERARALAANADWLALAPQVHRMTSAASSLHLTALAAHCRALETAARAATPDAATLAAMLPELWVRSLEALEAAVGV